MGVSAGVGIAAGVGGTAGVGCGAASAAESALRGAAASAALVLVPLPVSLPTADFHHDPAPPGMEPGSGAVAGESVAVSGLVTGGSVAAPSAPGIGFFLKKLNMRMRWEQRPSTPAGAAIIVG